MKKISLVIILVINSFAFLSCSNEESLTVDSNSVLFNSYELKRNANGEYSLDIKVENDVNISKVKNDINNTNEIYLSDTEVFGKQNYGADLMFDDENFTVKFITENSVKTPSISIIDDNIIYSEKSSDDFLKEYSISNSVDGLYDLDFTVKNNVSVEFVYDEEAGVYEIHLEESDKSKEGNDYSRTFEKEEGLLQIHFVNHTTYSSKTELAAFTERKPRIIIDEGEDL